MIEKIDQYLAWIHQSRGRSTATVVLYRAALLKLKKYLETVNIDFLKADLLTLEAFTGPTLHKNGLGIAGRMAVISAVRGFYSYLHRSGVSTHNPAHHLEYPRPSSPLPSTLSLKQIEQLMMAPDLKTFKGLRDAAMMAFIFATGCRVSGLVNLMEHDLVYGGDEHPPRLYALLDEKGKKQRKIPVNRKAELLISMYLGHAELKRIDRAVGTGRIVFVSLRNTRVPEWEFRGEKRKLTKKSIGAMLKGYGEPLGIPAGVLHAHAGRHAVGTLLYDSGMNVEDRQAFMGHSRVDTLTIYTRLSEKRLLPGAEGANPLFNIQTPVDALARALFPGSVRLTKNHRGNRE